MRACTWSTVSSTWSFTTTWAPRRRPASASWSALARRSARRSGGSPRPRRRSSCASREGASRKISSASRPSASTWAGPVDVDLEDHVDAVGRLGHGRAVEVPEELGPLQEAAGGDARLEVVPGHEAVGVGRLARTAGSRRPRTAQPEPLGHARPADRPRCPSRPLQGRRRPRSSTMWSAQPGNALSSASRCCAPSPRTRRGLADADVVHRATGLDLADTGKGLEHGHDLHLGHDRRRSRPASSSSAQVERAHLESLFELGAGPAGRSGLLEGGLALLGRECGRKRHVRRPSCELGEPARPPARPRPPGRRPRSPCGR